MIKNYLKEKEFIERGIKEAHKLYVSNDFVVSQKAAFDLVTTIDISIENYLVNLIKKEFPNDKIMAEENLSDTLVKGRTWIIDPIDGTVNMSHGIQIFGTQVALAIDDKPVFSLIYLPFMNASLVASYGEGAYYNDQKINLKTFGEMQNAIISFGDYTHSSSEVQQKQLNAVKTLIQKISKIRMFGSAAVDFSFASLGLTDGAMVITPKAWDIAPGVLLCKEAGLIVTNPQGSDYKIGDYGVLVSNNSKLHKLMIESYK